MEKQTNNQDIKARLAITLINAGYCRDTPLTRAIAKVDKQIKSISDDKAGKMLFNITFDQQRLSVNQFDFLDSFIHNVVPRCQDVTVLKSMLEQLVDAFMRIYADDDFVQLEYLAMSGDERVPSTYRLIVGLLLGSLRQATYPKNQYQFNLLAARLDGSPLTVFPLMLIDVMGQLLKEGVRMSPSEIRALLRLLTKETLYNLNREHNRSNTSVGTASEIGAGTHVNPHSHQPSADNHRAEDTETQAQRSDSNVRPAYQSEDDLSILSCKPRIIDQLLSVINKGYKPTAIGCAAVLIKNMLTRDRDRDSVKLVQTWPEYAPFEIERVQKEKELYIRLAVADESSATDKLATEIVLFAPMITHPERFIERLAYIEMHTHGAKYLR